MRKVLFVAIAVLLLAAACGDDDGGDGAPVFGADESAAPSDGGGDGDGATATTVGRDDEPVFGGGGGDICETAQRVQDEFDGSPIAGGDLSEASVEEWFGNLDDVFDEIEGDMPAEIAGDFATVRQGFADMRSALEDNDWDFLAAADDIEALDTDALNDASDNIEAYFEQECGISPTGDDSDSGPDISSLPDSAVEIFANAIGITRDEAQCLLDEMDLDLTDLGSDAGAEAFNDIGAFQDALSNCGLSLSDLGGAG